MFMQNIPRRKIYEHMLIYEENILELQILIRNEESFEKFYQTYKNSYDKAKKEFYNIMSLLVLFFENKKYIDTEEFEGALKFHVENPLDTIKSIKTNKNLTKQQINIIKDLFYLKIPKEIETLKVAKEIFKYFDEFNHIIPKILELRRDEMK